MRQTGLQILHTGLQILHTGPVVETEVSFLLTSTVFNLFITPYTTIWDQSLCSYTCRVIVGESWRDFEVFYLKSKDFEPNFQI